MKLLALLLASFWIAAAALASHPWAGVDICEVRRDTVPPGIDAATLPEPNSEGAILLQRHCTQCHNLPGPGRHVAQAWPAVMTRMETLMRVSGFYRGPLGPVTTPDKRERSVLLAYLERHALHELPASSLLAASAPAEQTYRSVCGDCHAAPDPRAYDATVWPGLIERMDRHRTVMSRPALDTVQRAAVDAFILQVRTGAHVPGPIHGATAPNGRTHGSGNGPGRWVSLGVFFGLSVAGIWRWRRGKRR